MNEENTNTTYYRKGVDDVVTVDDNEVILEGVTVTGLQRLRVYSDESDVLNSPITGDVDASYLAKGIRVEDVDTENIYDLYFPEKTGTLVVNDNGRITDINRLANSNNDIGIYFGNLGSELVLYSDESVVALSSSAMFANDCEHYLHFPDTSDQGEGSWKGYSWRLPSKSGTIAL